jgi:hypothetical protein
MVYIDGAATGEGVTVTKDPVSSIGNADIYENHVIVRHEGTNPLTIADMSVWDSSDDSDIPYTAITGATDTLSLPADTKLLVWNGKDFAPQGDITLAGSGAGAAYDGSLEVQSNGSFIANGTESHSIGGSFEFASNADFTAASSTITFTTSDVGRNIQVNGDEFYNTVFNGTGSWTMVDTDAFISGDITITSGSLTLPTGTTTLGASLTNNDTLDTNNGVLNFNGVGAGNTITLGGADAADVVFAGTGDWSMQDTTATVTQSFIVATGTVTLPSGNLAVGQDFIVSDTVDANGGTLELTNSSGDTTLTLSSNDLFTIRQTGAATTSVTDGSIALQGDLLVNSGTFNTPTGTLAVAGSLDVSAGVFNTATGTVLFNSDDPGEFIDMGTNVFYNAVVSGIGGGWTMLSSATTTNNFSLNNAASFTLASGQTLTVGGVFTNNVGGAATTWTGSTIVLDGQNEYTINSKTAGGDAYDTLVIGQDSNIRVWDSTATTTTLNATSSLYSQDHAGTDGDLYVYGDFTIGTTTEDWSFETDFDGDPLTGGDRRAVNVSLVDDASINVTDTGNLNMIGDSGATTTVSSQGTGQYTFVVDGGTINWNTYAFRDLPFEGIVATSTPSITSLSFGDFEVDRDGGTALQLERDTLDANPSLNIPGVRFARVAPAIVGVNVRLSATSTNAWRFSGSYGNIAGEDFDVDGLGSNLCGSIRWDDSSCLLTEQTEYRWRNDDGGIGVPDSEWFDLDFEHRQQVRVVNQSANLYTDAVVNLTVPYDADMQSDFDDLRFTTDNGLTLTDFWIEKQNASTEAEVWVVVPTLPANETTQLFMYYGSSTAVSVSSSTAVFSVIDTFEDNNISEYSGDTTKFQTNTTLNYGGSYGLQAVNTGDFSTGIARTDQTINQGETIRTKVYVDAGPGDGDEQCVLFGVQSTANINDNYGVCLIQFATDERVSLVRDAVRNDTAAGAVILASTTYDFTTSGWYEVEVDWNTDDSMDVRVFNPTGSLIATTSATDSTYSSGGYGFTYWTNHGAWDDFHTRPITDGRPQALLGNKQQPGGASYAADQSTPTSAFTVGDTARLRVAIENTGLSITGQEYQIEYASKGVAPSCAAVPAVDYAPVPDTAGCTGSAICMATSTFVSNGAVTTDLLLIDANDFTAGEFVEDPSNQTGLQNLDQNDYTELEYALRVTNDAVDQGYCFRVTNDGTAYDSYQEVPELSLRFDPVLGAINLNNGADISLLPGTTTAVLATGTVTDLNGFADLEYATSTIYRSGVGASCALDNNNCYISSTPTSCQFVNCAGTSCDIECTANIFFHADPTDSGTFSGEDWLAFVEVEDSSGAYTFGNSPSVELNTIRAIDVVGAIDYGALPTNSDTGSFNASTSIFNLGNVAADLQITGSDLFDGVSSVIPAEQQKFATSTFTYSTCTTCELLSTSTPVDVDVDLSKPAVDTPPVTDEVFWGIAVPVGINSAPHQGINVFTPVSP